MKYELSNGETTDSLAEKMFDDLGYDKHTSPTEVDFIKIKDCDEWYVSFHLYNKTYDGWCSLGEDPVDSYPINLYVHKAICQYFKEQGCE